MAPSSSSTMPSMVPPPCPMRADISLARQTDRSASRERPSAGSSASDWMDLDESSHAADAVAASSRRSSLATSSIGSSLASVPMSRVSSIRLAFVGRDEADISNLRPPQAPLRYAARRSIPSDAAGCRSGRCPSSSTWGPRMSSNYRCLGIDVGATVPGTPASVKIGFESSGGDGAILIPRDPTERTRLKYLGVLKAYIKAHHKWIYDTYGRIEAIGIDDLALIYGQDRTSDWAVAVSRDTARGARVEFEIFGGISSGFWGNWSHALSACQRGPHRPKGRRNKAAAAAEPDGRNAQHVHAPGRAQKAAPKSPRSARALASVKASSTPRSPSPRSPRRTRPTRLPSVAAVDRHRGARTALRGQRCMRRRTRPSRSVESPLAPASVASSLRGLERQPRRAIPMWTVGAIWRALLSPAPMDPLRTTATAKQARTSSGATIRWRRCMRGSTSTVALASRYRSLRTTTAFGC
ncbi:hypothetical protein L1887_55109 [Cichorium endivia]|nr:hypothetical protein L1887_55109 [Cichorium endivia]